MSEHELGSKAKANYYKKKKKNSNSRSVEQRSEIIGSSFNGRPCYIKEVVEQERILSPESLFNFDFGLFSGAKKSE